MILRRATVVLNFRGRSDGLNIRLRAFDFDLCGRFCWLGRSRFDQRLRDVVILVYGLDHRVPDDYIYRGISDDDVFANELCSRLVGNRFEGLDDCRRLREGCRFVRRLRNAARVFDSFVKIGQRPHFRDHGRLEQRDGSPLTIVEQALARRAG